MTEDISDSGDVGPRHFGKAVLLRSRNMPGGFRHDLDATFDRASRSDIGLEGFEVEIRDDLRDLVHCLKDVPKPDQVGRLHARAVRVCTESGVCDLYESGQLGA